MNFDLTEDHKVLQEAIREAARKVIAPQAAYHDKAHQIHPDVLQLLKDLGAFGSYFPEEYGGAGLDFFSYALLIEELARACASTSVLISAHSSLCMNPIYEFGTPEQKQRFLPLLASGERIGCFLLSEPNAGSDPAGMDTRFEEQGDHYLVNGGKIFITNGGYQGIGILFATQDKNLKHKGISAFILDLQTPGVEVIKNEEKMGIRGSLTTQFGFTNVRIPKENLLGTIGQGFKIAMETLNGGRVGIAAQSLGIGQAALDLAIAYAKERKQFGKVLGEFQAIQFKLAEMAMDLESARLLTYKAAWLKDQKRDFSFYSAMAKAKASEACCRISDEALQIYAGNGYICEYPLERLVRDSRITKIYEGTNEVQRIVIAKQLLI